MSVLFIALPIAILLGAAGMLACVFCIRSGQYDDLDSPSVRILLDDRVPNQPAVEKRATEKLAAPDSDSQ